MPDLLLAVRPAPVSEEVARAIALRALPPALVAPTAVRQRFVPVAAVLGHAVLLLSPA